MPRKPNNELRNYWQIFRDDRFIPADLWRWFRGAYYDAGGREPWPREDFLRWLGLDRKAWIDEAPGPRGGKGWRISPDAVAVCQAEEEYIQRTHAQASTLAAGAIVQVGELILEQSLSVPRVWRLVWHFEPPAAVPGPNIDGQSRHSPTAPFSFRAPCTTEPANLQERITAAEAHVKRLTEQAIETHTCCIEQLRKSIASTPEPISAAMNNETPATDSIKNYVLVLVPTNDKERAEVEQAIMRLKIRARFNTGPIPKALAKTYAPAGGLIIGPSTQDLIFDPLNNHQYDHFDMSASWSHRDKKDIERNGASNHLIAACYASIAELQLLDRALGLPGVYVWHWHQWAPISHLHMIRWA